MLPSWSTVFFISLSSIKGAYQGDHSVVFALRRIQNLLFFRQIPFQQKSQKIGESIKLTVKSNAFISELNAVFYKG